MTAKTLTYLVIDMDGFLSKKSAEVSADNTLPITQREVDGRVDVVELMVTVDAWINDEGLYLYGRNTIATDVMRALGAHSQGFHGPVMFTGRTTEGATVSLLPDQIDWIRKVHAHITAGMPVNAS